MVFMQNMFLGLRQIGKKRNILNRVVNYNFFWSKKEEESNKKEQKVEEQKRDEDSFSNISHLIEKMKSDNKKKQKLLPPKTYEDQDKLTVVVEMDEVLLYVFAPDEHEAYMSQPLQDTDFCLEYKEYDTYLSVYKRPNLDGFLKYLKENTEPILYTNGVKSYVDIIMKHIDPDKTFKHIITQEDGCTRIIDEKENIDDYFKDLELLGRDLSRVVYIDSKPFSFWAQPDNGVPVHEFMADSTIKDVELIDLVNFLEEIKEEEDVRKICAEKFGVREALKDTNFL